MTIVLTLLFDVFAAGASQVPAQLRESTVAWQDSGGCRAETQLPDGNQLRWHAALNPGSDSVLQIAIVEDSETRDTLDIGINESWVGITKCQVYGADEQEIAVVHLGTIMDDYPKRETASIVSFVRLSPDLEHLYTSVIRTRTAIGDSRQPIDFFSWYRGDGYARSNLEIVHSDGSLRAVRVEIRRPIESHDEFVIGASSRVIGQNDQPYPPPEWLSERQATVAPFDNPVYRPLAPVETPEGIVAVLSAEPETMFPPRKFVIDMKIGQRRAHGLLFRDLGAARWGDRNSAEIGVKNFKRSLKIPPNGPTGESGGHADFQWADRARSMIGTPRLDVAVMNDTMIIGTIERECPDAPLGDAAPRDLWIFKVDLQDGDPAWIETQLVASCALVPARGLDNVGFLYRTFDNGRIEPRVVDGVTVGLRVILDPARPVFSKGEPRIAEWSELRSHSKWVEVADLLERFEPQYAEIVY